MSSSLIGSLLLRLGCGQNRLDETKIFCVLFHLKKYGSVPARDN
jgi:hypothetical protein